LVAVVLGPAVFGPHLVEPSPWLDPRPFAVEQQHQQHHYSGLEELGDFCWYYFSERHQVQKTIHQMCRLEMLRRLL